MEAQFKTMVCEYLLADFWISVLDIITDNYTSELKASLGLVPKKINNSKAYVKQKTKMIYIRHTEI